MAYDAHKKQLGVKAIGTVESGLKYDSVNYNDPITLGIAQWYGTRAAGILARIKAENGSSWSGVAASVDASLAVHPANNSYWNSRYLTKAEGESLRPVLRANGAIQDAQLGSDMDGYRDVYARQGGDPNGNTDAMLFFMVMYHQSPRQALRVLSTAGSQSDMNRLYAFCLNDSVLGRYKSRYTTARDIIASNDASGTAGGGGDPLPGGNGGVPDTSTNSGLSYVERAGANLILRFVDGHKVQAYSNGSGYWKTKRDQKAVSGTDVPPNPGAGGGGTVTEQQQKMVQWMQARLDKFAYSQAGGRLNPDKSGYTDCSGLWWRCYQDCTGIDVGTWTGAMQGKGKTIYDGSPRNAPWESFQLCDLILIWWHGTGGASDHVEGRWTDVSHICGHGGPDPGPDIQTNDYIKGHAARIMVKRHLNI